MILGLSEVCAIKHADVKRRNVENNINLIPAIF